MKKIYYTWSDVESQTQEILRQIALSDWRPDYVVGLTRGGLTPANLISQYLEVPMECLKVSLRDGGQTESNCWMAEDAYGYKSTDDQDPKRILIVDDINDSGATLNWIREDWQSSCMPDDTDRWDSIWGGTTRFAVMVNNEASDFKDVNYVGQSINKLEESIWCVFPWEEWWR